MAADPSYSTKVAIVQGGDTLQVASGGSIVLDSGSTLNVGGTLIVGAATLSAAELAVLDAVTAGTVAASKAVVVDASADASGFRNITITGSIFDPVGTLAAAGTIQGDAAALLAGLNQVTASDGTKGVILPVATAGMTVTVVNTVSAQNLKVWPQVGGTIDFGSANAAQTLAGQKSAIYKAYSATQWYRVLTA